MMFQMHRVVVTGMGAVTPMGAGVQALAEGVFSHTNALRFNEQLQFVVGLIPDGAVNYEQWTAGERREMSKASQLALVAAKEAMETSGTSSLMHTDTLVHIGTGVSDLDAIHQNYTLVNEGKARKVSPYFVPRILNNLPAGYVAMKYGMMGGIDSSSTACATGVHCIGNAFRAVRHGWARRALAGATESSVNALAVTGFDRMRALARGRDALSMPFDSRRSGFVLSEGAGLLMLERLDDALERKATIHAEIRGFGISSDCYHITSPHPSGIGAKLCMQRALEDASCSADEVGYVNAHATSTPTGDGIEASAVRQLFLHRQVPLSSIKGHIGHLLGAAGAVETIATISAVEDGKIPPNLNLDKSDVDEGVFLVKEVEEWREPTRIAIVNSFGFGGTNACVVISNYQS